MTERELRRYCAACLLEKRLDDLPADAPPALAEEYRRRVRAIVADNPDMSSPEKDHEITLARAALFGSARDYTDVKRRFNAMMLALEPDMTARAMASGDPLRRAAQYAMAGNFIDFAVLRDVDEAKLAALLEDSGNIPIDPDTLEAFRRELVRARRLVYILDNCGEIVADKVLMRAIRAVNPDIEITAMVRGAPVVNDADRSDAEQVRLAEVAQRVADTGCGIAGCPLGRVSRECLETLRRADVLVSKGQANFETLDGCGLNIFFLFMCKCQLFVNRFNVPLFTGILTRQAQFMGGGEGKGE